MCDPDGNDDDNDKDDDDHDDDNAVRTVCQDLTVRIGRQDPDV